MRTAGDIRAVAQSPTRGDQAGRASARPKTAPSREVGSEASHPDSGMVLIEVLAALAIVAVMAGLMAGFMGQLGVVSSLARDAGARSELAAAADHLRQTLESARPIPLGLDSEPELVFDGSEAAVRFSGITRRGFRALALRRIDLFAEGQRLVQSIGPMRPGASPDSIVVLDGLAGLRFAYGDEAGTFADAWRTDALPAAVRITLWRSLDGRTVAAETVARLR